MHIYNKDLEHAQKVLTNIDDVIETYFKGMHPLFCVAHELLGDFLMEKSMFEDAVSEYSQVLDSSLECFGPEHI